MLLVFFNFFNKSLPVRATEIDAQYGINRARKELLKLCIVHFGKADGASLYNLSSTMPACGE